MVGLVWGGIMETYFVEYYFIKQRLYLMDHFYTEKLEWKMRLPCLIEIYMAMYSYSSDDKIIQNL